MRVVCFKMGKTCVEAEALEERRRQAKIRAAKKNMQGQRRSFSEAVIFACPSSRPLQYPCGFDEDFPVSL